MSVAAASAAAVTTGPLRLGCTSSPRWLEACLADLPAVLSDHAHCERKAAASALSLVSRFPHDVILVRAMAALAREEAGHLQRVHQAMTTRGWPLLPDAKDPYVLALRSFVARGRAQQDVDELLVCALIEARSAERLALLGNALPDPELARLYQDLARSEDGHATLFVERARAHATQGALASRLAAWLDHEAQVVAALVPSARIHG